MTLVLVVEVVEVVLVVLLLMLFCNCTVTLVGGLIPSVCALSRLTCITALRSAPQVSPCRDRPQFLRQSHLIRRARTTIAPCEGNC